MLRLWAATTQSRLKPNYIDPANVKKKPKLRRVRRESDKRSRGMDLLAHLFEMMDLFPIVSEAAAGELAERMMTERLRREVAGRNLRLVSAKAGRREKR